MELDILGGIAEDLAGNPNLPLPSPFGTTVDTLLPQPVIIGPGGLTNQDPFDVTVDFGEQVVGFEAADVLTTNASVTGFIDNLDGSFLLQIDPLLDGLVELDILGGIAFDLAGNPNLPLPAPLVTEFDSLQPQPVILQAPPSPTNLDPFPVTVGFGELMNGFDQGDVLVSNGTVASFTDNNDGTFDLLIDPLLDGPVIFDIAGNVAQDLAGNPNLPLPAPLVTEFDSLPPQPEFLNGPTGPINLDPFFIDVFFGEPILGFDPLDPLDLVANNANVLGFVPIDPVLGGFELQVQPIVGGSLTLEIPAGIATDEANNPNLAAVPFLVDVDAAPPQPEFVNGPTGPINLDPFFIDVFFGEPILGFDPLDPLDLVANNANVLGFVPIDPVLGGFELQVQPIVGGSLTLEIPAGIATDEANNPNLAAVPFSVDVDAAPPQPEFLNGPTGPINLDPFFIDVFFGEPILGFDPLDPLDLVANNATVLGFVPIDPVLGGFELQVQPIVGGSLTLEIPAGIATDEANNPNLAAVPFLVDVDALPPQPEFVNGPTGPINLDPFFIDVFFGEPILGFDPLDPLDLVANNATVLGFVPIDPVLGGFELQVQPIVGGSLTLEIPAGIATDEANNPNLAAVPFSVDVDAAPPQPVITGPSSPTNQDPFAVAIDFGGGCQRFRGWRHHGYQRYGDGLD